MLDFEDLPCQRALTRFVNAPALPALMRTLVGLFCWSVLFCRSTCMCVRMSTVCTYEDEDCLYV